MRKVADKMNYPPTVQRASMLAAIGKCRHSREPHAVLDDPEKLSIRKVLRFRQTQIRWLGVESLANHAVPPSVVGVANRAMLREMQPRIPQFFGRGEHRVLGQPRVRWHRQTAHLASGHGFKFAGSCPRT